MSMFGNAAIFANNFGDTTPPNKPSLSSSVTTDTSIIISGSSTDNITVTGYDVYVDAVLYDTITGASFTGYSIGGLASETNYDIYIIAKDLRGNESVPSDTINFTTDVYVPPLDIIAPTWSGNNLSYTAVTSTGVTLNWTAATDNVAVTGYSIYKDNNLLLNVGNVLTYDITGLTQYTPYSFKLKAMDAAGNLSAFSNTVTFTTVDAIAPSKPTLTYSDIDITTITISSISTDNVAVIAYDIYIDSVLYETVNGASLANYNVDGLTASTNYDLFVVAKDAAGNSSIPSDIVNFTTGENIPNTPIIIDVSFIPNTPIIIDVSFIPDTIAPNTPIITNIIWQ